MFQIWQKFSIADLATHIHIRGNNEVHTPERINSSDEKKTGLRYQKIQMLPSTLSLNAYVFGPQNLLCKKYWAKLS